MTRKLQQIPLVRDLSVGDVAERAGVAVSTLHFYEAEGLIKGWRNSSNHRRYGRDVLGASPSSRWPRGRGFRSRRFNRH